jgi:hypothetical protein
MHLVAECYIICSPRSRRPVRKLLDTPSYIYVYILQGFFVVCLFFNILLLLILLLHHLFRPAVHVFYSRFCWSSDISQGYDHCLDQWYSTGGTRRHLRGYVKFKISIYILFHE